MCVKGRKEQVADTITQYETYYVVKRKRKMSPKFKRFVSNRMPEVWADAGDWGPPREVPPPLNPDFPHVNIISRDVECGCCGTEVPWYEVRMNFRCRRCRHRMCYTCRRSMEIEDRVTCICCHMVEQSDA